MIGGGNAVTVATMVYAPNTTIASPGSDDSAGDTSGVEMFCNAGPVYWYRLRTSSDVTISGGTFPANIWTLMAVTYDGSTVRGYANGLEVASGSQSGNLNDSGTAFHIGTRGVYVGEYGWLGAIAFTRIWNRALSQAELRDQYLYPWAIYNPPRRIYVAVPAAAPAASFIPPPNHIMRHIAAGL